MEQLNIHAIVFIRNIQNEGELERLHREIECIARVEYEGLSIAISVGAAFCPVDGTSFEALFAQADRMLYREKSIKGHRGLYQESPEPWALGMGEASPIPIPLCATQKNNQEGSGLADGSHQI